MIKAVLTAPAPDGGVRVTLEFGADDVERIRKRGARAGKPFADTVVLMLKMDLAKEMFSENMRAQNGR